MNAVEARGGNATFELHLRRRPFFLYPGGHHAIRPWGDRLDAIYPGGRESIRHLGDRAGFSFNFNAPLSDTMDSHRLYVWAERQGGGKGEALAQAVGHQYFEQAQALSDRAMLCGCAAIVGLDAEAAATKRTVGGGGWAPTRGAKACSQHPGERSRPSGTWGRNSRSVPVKLPDAASKVSSARLVCSST